MRFELTTFSLATRCSTTELRPRLCVGGGVFTSRSLTLQGLFLQKNNPACFFLVSKTKKTRHTLNYKQNLQKYAGKEI